MSMSAPGKYKDEVLGTARPMPPSIPEGEYSGVFVRAEKGRFERRERWFLWFSIITSGHVGTELYLCCPCPEGNVFGTGSKMIAAYAVATGGLPRRRDRISTKVFRDKAFKFAVRTVTHDSRGEERHPADHYSVIDRLISCDTRDMGASR